MQPIYKYDTLDQDEWLEWNSSTWGLRAERVRYQPAGESYYLTGVLYLDRRGRVRMPPITAYLPFRFVSSGPARPERVSRQWIAVADLFARDLQSRKMVGRIALPPGFDDARPFQWAGLTSETKYTYTTELPHASEQESAAVRKNYNKAVRAGFTFDSEASSDEIARCLEATANRKGFEYRVGATALRELFDGLGQRVRTHSVRDQDGRAVSAGARLVSQGGTALDWVQGTEFPAMKTGAAQLMYKGVLEDLAAQGAQSFDFGGANIREVSAAKAAWGMNLTPYITLSEFDLRSLYRATRGATSRVLRRS